MSAMSELPWHEALDNIRAIEREEKYKLSVDQRIAVAQVLATLSVASELSQIRDGGLTVYPEDTSNIG